MTPELTYLTWTLVLALIQIMAVAQLRTMEVGFTYNAGPRDVSAPRQPGLLTGRLMRAQRNLFETLPVFIAAVLVAHTAQLESHLTHLGAQLYFWARVAYVPIYGLGLPYIRTLAWGVSMVGIVLLLIALLHPTA